MAAKTIKSQINDVIFFCSFKTEKTIKTEESTIYTLYDINSDFKFKCILTNIDEDNKQHLVVLHQGLNNISDINLRRFNKVIERLQKIPNINVIIEDMSDNDISEETLEKFNQLCKEYNITEGE